MIGIGRDREGNERSQGREIDSYALGSAGPVAGVAGEGGACEW